MRKEFNDRVIDWLSGPWCIPICFIAIAVYVLGFYYLSSWVLI